MEPAAPGAGELLSLTPVGPVPEAADRLLSEGEAGLWRAWRSDGDPAARTRLLALHLPYARVVAASLYGRRRNDEIEFGDYLQLACLALVEAAGRFDPDRGVAFRTYAARRLHGAILDGIERLTEKQQQIAARKRIEALRREDAKQAALARVEAAGRGLGTQERALVYVAEAGLAFALAWLLEGTGLVRSADEIGQRQEFYASTEIRQLRERLAERVRALPAQEFKVVHEHYFQARAFEAIAADMRLTKGRISQIHRKAIERLRSELGPGGGVDVAC